MCGIAGIYNSKKCAEELKQIGNKFIQLLNHRGPDGNGIQLFSDHQRFNSCLTHNRLSIIDLSSDANQPMSKYNSRLWISFNGEIYNFRELRDELHSKGERFITNSDTEVILASYKVWGTKCFEKFIGMWALAIYDKDENSLILCRDRLGIKPLYYKSDGHEVVFGSEPKVILSYSNDNHYINSESLSDYFSYRFPLGNKSFYKNIKSLDPGSYIKFNKNIFKKKYYWKLPAIAEKEKVDIGEDKILNDVSELLTSSINYRMISDVPFGAFLSGGLDSSIIVSEMSKLNKNKIRTYNIGFKEDKFNEFIYATEVSNLFKTKHTQILMDENEYFSSMPEIIKYKDGPLSVPNEIAIHRLSKELKKNISVVLSGEGADELFGGYGRIFRSAYDFSRFHKYGVDNLNKDLKKNLLNKYNVNDFNSEIDFFISQYSYIDFTMKKNLFMSDYSKQFQNNLFNKNFFENEWSNLSKLELHEKFIYFFQKIHLQGLLGRLDCSTMSSSVEGRVPFTDHRLIEYVNKLPLKYKLRFDTKFGKIIESLNSDQISEKYDVTKYTLRKMYKDKLPESIIKRLKVGFPVPLTKWLVGSKAEITDKLFSSNSKTKDIFDQSFLKEVINNKKNSKNAGLLIWMVLNVEEWMHSYDLSAG